MNEHGTQRYVRKVWSAYKMLCLTLDVKHPNPMHVAIAKRRVWDFLWNLRRTSGVGNDGPFLPGDQVISITTKKLERAKKEAEKQALMAEGES